MAKIVSALFLLGMILFPLVCQSAEDQEGWLLLTFTTHTHTHTHTHSIIDQEVCPGCAEFKTADAVVDDLTNSIESLKQRVRP